MACTDITDVVERLSRFYSLDEIDDWLSAEHPQLSGESAQAVIARGEKYRVHRVIDRLEADAYI